MNTGDSLSPCSSNMEIGDLRFTGNINDAVGFYTLPLTQGAILSLIAAISSCDPLLFEPSLRVLQDYAISITVETTTDELLNIT